jgi:hypothetical protein
MNDKHQATGIFNEINIREEILVESFGDSFAKDPQSRG